jgi:single-strand DNA-binding protein
MSSGFVNKVYLVGNLAADPEVHPTSNGGKLAKFTVATNERIKDANGNVEEKTEWNRVVVFGAQADIAEQYLRKGKLVAVEGAIHNNKYVDKDGVDRESLEIHITQFKGGFTMLGAKNDGGSYPDNNPQQHSSAPGNDGGGPDSGDIPF